MVIKNSVLQFVGSASDQKIDKNRRMQNSSFYAHVIPNHFMYPLSVTWKCIAPSGVGIPIRDRKQKHDLALKIELVYCARYYREQQNNSGHGYLCGQWKGAVG